jgi:PadR family transcriptional regulator, regulatory protein PadR
MRVGCDRHQDKCVTNSVGDQLDSSVGEVSPTVVYIGLRPSGRPSSSRFTCQIYTVGLPSGILPLTFYRNQAILSPRMSTKEQKERIELLQGTLDLLILRTLVLGPMHGHAIAKAIEFRSDEVLQVEQGSLYPALHRLIKRQWISAEEGTSENNRRAKFYRLTAKGRRQLAVETSKWGKLAGAIARILQPAEQEGES